MKNYLLRIIGIGTIFAILMLSMIASVSAEDAPLSFEGSCPTSGFEIYCIAVSDGYAYIADITGLAIVDISNPADPTLACRYDDFIYDDFISGAEGVAVSGSYAYVVGQNLDFVILDVSDPYDPTPVGSSAITGRGVVVSGSYAYVTGMDGSFNIIDVSDPYDPTPVGSCTAGSDVVLSGSYAYVVGSSGLTIIDVSDPYDPTPVGSIATRGNHVDVSGSYAYVVESSGLAIVDVSDPYNPTLAHSYDCCPDKEYDVAVSGDYAYVACIDSNLLIFDVSDPYNPTPAGGSDLMEVSLIVTISDGYVYVGDPTYGLFIFKTSGNDAPEILSLSSPTAPIAVNEPVPISAEFIDDGVLDHTATINWGDDNTDTIYPVDGFSISENHAYTTTGVYTITLTVTDGAGESDTMTSDYVVVHNPEGGFVTGGEGGSGSTGESYSNTAIKEVDSVNEDTVMSTTDEVADTGVVEQVDVQDEDAEDTSSSVSAAGIVMILILLSAILVGGYAMSKKKD